MRSRRAASLQKLPLELPEESGSARTCFEARVRDFARAVALRHRREGGNAEGLRRALTGYYGTLTLLATSPVPPLDDAAIDLALATYHGTKNSTRRRAAA